MKNKTSKLVNTVLIWFVIIGRRVDVDHWLELISGMTPFLNFEILDVIVFIDHV